MHFRYSQGQGKEGVIVGEISRRRVGGGVIGWKVDPVEWGPII